MSSYFPFRFITFLLLTVHEKLKKYTLSAVQSPILAFTISFWISFVEFVFVVESCCWVSVFVVVVQSPVLIFVSAAIPSTFTQTTSRALILLDLPSPTTLCELSPRKPYIGCKPPCVFRLASQPSFSHLANLLLQTLGKLCPRVFAC
jgi:hypothetical protein